jgi:hypothetical protein
MAYKTLKERVDAAAAAERERCAVLVERHCEHLRLPIPFSDTITFRVCQELAQRIRTEHND